MPAWLVESGGRMHEVESGQRITIGRAPDNTIVVANAQASRHHATIWSDGERWWVEDQGTKNGTLLNGGLITERRQLREGDEIFVPGLTMTFRLSDETMTVAARLASGLGVAGTKTFLFADLRDFTSFVERHGDAAAAALIADYRHLVRAEVLRTGGAEIKTEGDSFFVVFDSARQALDCGVGLVRAAARHSREHPERPIRVGVGVHAGEPVAQQRDYVGSAVNLAARLAQNARASEVLVSDVVRGLLRTSGLPPMTVREGLTLKGIDDPPRIFALVLDEAVSGSGSGGPAQAG